MKAALLVLVVVVALLLLVAPKPDVTGPEARRMVKEGAKLVDVRSAGEFGAGHIDGAINIPISELAERLDELGDKNEPVVLYCHSGMRSTRGAKLLRSRGFETVKNLGAMNRW